MEKAMILDEKVEAEIGVVKSIVKNPDKTPEALLNRHSSLYGIVVDYISGGTRNTGAQLEYLSAYEQALAVFKVASLELRREMDILTLEKRLETRASAVSKPRKGKDGLETQIAEGVMLSNRYALFMAGHVGLAILSIELSDATDLKKQLEEYESVQDHDKVASYLAIESRNHILEMFDEKRLKKEELTDDDLKNFLGQLFTTWINQFKWSTFREVTEQFGLADLKLQYDKFSVTAGEFSRKYSQVVVDERFRNVGRADIINSADHIDVIWNNLVQLVAYDHEKHENPFSPASAIFVTGGPGTGKTVIAHALIRDIARECEKAGIPFWALTHSTTDYASEYQNKTSNELANLAAQINNFPGPVVMYISDADNIFLTRSDPRLTAEQRQTMSVYFKMFDGQLIPKNGKFMAVMDSNYVASIDEATASRIFDEMLELKRFEKAGDFAQYARMKVTKGLPGIALSDEEWLEIGKYVLETEPLLSNRQIEYVTNRIRRIKVPSGVIGLPYAEKIAYRNEQLKSITADFIIGRFSDYQQRLYAVHVKAVEEQMGNNLAMMLQNLQTPAKETAESPS